MVIEVAEKDDADEWMVVQEAPLYEVNSVGDIRKILDHTLVSRYPTAQGYWGVGLMVDDYNGKKQRTFMVHRVVCTAFYGPANPAMGQRDRVAFKDGNKFNCRRSNVYWRTVTKDNAQVVAEIQRRQKLALEEGALGEIIVQPDELAAHMKECALVTYSPEMLANRLNCSTKQAIKVLKSFGYEQVILFAPKKRRGW